TQAHMKAAGAQSYGRHDGVIRPFSWPWPIDMPRPGKPEPPALQHKSTTGHRIARAKPFENTGHERDRQTLSIHHYRADGVACRTAHHPGSLGHGRFSGLQPRQFCRRLVGRPMPGSLHRLQHGDAMCIARTLKKTEFTKSRAHRYTEKALMPLKVLGTQ